jgi:hypothetical protein
VTAVVIYMPIVLFNIVTITAIQEFFKRFGAIDRQIGIVKARMNNCGVCFLMCGDIEVNVWIMFDCPIISFHFVCFFKVVCDDLKLRKKLWISLLVLIYGISNRKWNLNLRYCVYFTSLF